MIGNPPYISAPAQVANPTLNEQRKQIVACKKYDSLYQKWDLYIPFIEHGIQLLSSDGVCSMIVPYPLTNQTYAKKLRQMLLNDNNTFELVDLNGTKVFENATVSNCIPFVRRFTSNEQIVKISHINEHRSIEKVYTKSYVQLVQDENKYIWNLSENKENASSKNQFSELNVLGDFCYISVGMVLNADEKTAKGEFTKDDLISEAKDDIHCREYIEAKDIERYNVKRERFIEYNTARCPNKLRRPTFRELYNCKKLMFNRLGTLQVYLDEQIHYLHSDSMFSAVLWKDLKAVDNKSIKASVKRYSKMSRKDMEQLSSKIDLSYLLGILNSKFATELLQQQRGGDYHIYPEHLRNIPIPLVSVEMQQPIIERVNKILKAKQYSPKITTSELETEIDELVYSLYNISDNK